MSNQNKYNVDNSKLGKLKRTYDGILFDSQLERRFYTEYILPKIKQGIIKEVKRQVRYELQPDFEHKDKKYKAIGYVSDFDITYSNGLFSVIDVKGMIKPIDKIKAKLFRYKYPDIDFSFMRYSKNQGWYRC